ncbi:MAG: hypothetical protein H7327_09995 [Herminiimonas sp.]|nr:hypothetical protein [Herminiimonas sp.]
MQPLPDKSVVRAGSLLARLLRLTGVLWALPLSLLGLLLVLPVLVAGGSLQRLPGKLFGVPALVVRGRAGDFLLAHHPFGAMHAMAIGHIIIANRAARSHRLLAHELEHVAQAARWGVVFPLAYLGASAWALLRGGEVYWDNGFEVAARKAERRLRD